MSTAHSRCAARSFHPVEPIFFGLSFCRLGAVIPAHSCHRSGVRPVDLHSLAVAHPLPPPPPPLLTPPLSPHYHIANSSSLPAPCVSVSTVRVNFVPFFFLQFASFRIHTLISLSFPYYCSLFAVFDYSPNSTHISFPTPLPPLLPLIPLTAYALHTTLVRPLRSCLYRLPVSSPFPRRPSHRCLASGRRSSFSVSPPLPLTPPSPCPL